MISYEIVTHIKGVLMLLRVKIYTDNKVVVNRLDTQTFMPIETIDPMLLKI